MSTAHLLGLTDKYEMDKLKRPKAKEKPVESFTPAEQKLIEQAVMADRREKMKGIIICLYTGLFRDLLDGIVIRLQQFLGVSQAKLIDVFEGGCENRKKTDSENRCYLFRIGRQVDPRTVRDR